MKLALPAALVAAPFVLSACSDLTAAQQEVLMSQGLYVVERVTDGKVTVGELDATERRDLQATCEIAKVWAPDEYEAIAFICELLEVN